jgi:hypothetical protein
LAHDKKNNQTHHCRYEQGNSKPSATVKPAINDCRFRLRLIAQDEGLHVIAFKSAFNLQYLGEMLFCQSLRARST